AFAFNPPVNLNDNQRRGTVEDDGKIVASGYTDLGGALDNHVFLVRLNADGTLDDTFGGFSDEPTIPATPGVAVFNPFKVDGGYAEAYASGFQASTSSYVVVGYGEATARGSMTGSTLGAGYETTIAQDIVLFRVSTGTSTGIDTSFANNGTQAVQSEGQGFPSSQDRGRHLIVLPDERTVVAGLFGEVPAAVVFDANGQPDTSVFGDGIIELSDPTGTNIEQFYGIALSPDGSRVALSTRNATNNTARLVVLKFAVN
ncbi:MAG: hypothetical protein AAGA33_15275, partial [Pseudomonadota bacterium]